MSRVGFIGLGIMGRGMAARLVNNGGHEIAIYNRTRSVADEFASLLNAQCPGNPVTVLDTPAEVVEASSITYGMLSDPAAAHAVVFDSGGVLEACSSAKAYIDCSTVDEVCSQKIAAAVSHTGARFLEAPVSGSKGPAEQGQLIFLCAGDASLYDEALTPHLVPCMGKMSKYVSSTVGQGARFKLVVNGIMGTMGTALAEGMALANASELEAGDILEVLGAGAMANPMFAMKGPCMAAGEYPTNFPLKHQQKDLRLALELAHQLHLQLPVLKASDDQYRKVRQSHGDGDFSAVAEAYKPEFMWPNRGGTVQERYGVKERAH
jgi:glyoxylate/succinic semialdehyde reductase